MKGVRVGKSGSPLLCVAQPKQPPGAPHPFDDWFHVYLLEATRHLRSSADRLPSKQWHYTQPARKTRCACGKSVEAGRTQCSSCRVSERGRLRKPCECGGKYFARGKCRSCYFVEYNAARVRSERAA